MHLLYSNIKNLLKRLRNKIKRLMSGRPNLTNVGSAFVLPDHLTANLVIDVGVSGGTPYLYSRFPNADLILIDPLDEVASLYNLINDRKYEQYILAAGSSNGTISINFDKTRPARSSIMQRTALTKNPTHFIEEKLVEVKTLDNIVKSSDFAIKDVGLKIDTEGFEMEVLKGAGELLKKCNFVICEASIEKRFEDGYSFSDLVVFMSSKNFKLTKLLSCCEDRNGLIRFVDVLFEPC